MLKFLAVTYANKITPIEVSRETDSFVWIGGRKRSRRMDNEFYADTEHQAREFLLRNLREKRDFYTEQVTALDTRIADLAPK